jgi:putative ABC transport system permease protein
MIVKTAVRTVWHDRGRLSGAIFGVALGVFLTIFQWALYSGFKRDITVVLDAFDADVWIVPTNQTVFDGYAQIDDLSYWRAKNVAGVQDSARIVWGNATWRLPSTGSKDYLQILGIDLDSSLDTHFQFQGISQDLATVIRPDGHVLIGTRSRGKLEYDSYPEGPFEIQGVRAEVVGFVDEVRLFTTAGFALTDIRNAQRYLQLPPSHVTYIVCKCYPEANVAEVVQRLQAAIPDHDVLTTQQFRKICSDYWATSSGIGPVILVSAALGVLVGFIIVGLTFYISTMENLRLYACLKALGATMSEIVVLLSVQAVLVYIVGSGLAGLLLWTTTFYVRDAVFSILVTPNLVLLALGAMLLCSATGVLLSARMLFRVEPGEAFRT